MRKKSILHLSITAMALTAGLAGGSGIEVLAEEHEPIVMNAPYNNMSFFVDEVHKKYPEINLEVVPYDGYNTTAYMKEMLESGEVPDIYFTTYYKPDVEDVSDKFLDLSGYDFMDRYVAARLQEVTVDGAVYMLPLAYNCLGITYNKTLLDENGWKLPDSLEEMEALKPEVEAAGYQFAMTELEFPGSGFQYVFNILSTSYVSTLDGMRWQHDFLNGDATMKGSAEMLEDMQLLQRWKEDGLLNANGDLKSDNSTVTKMAEGNTLFLIGNSNDVLKMSGAETMDHFRVMPYLSVDGSQNVYMLNVSRYVGLNKALAEEGNEQKLEDALHVMEVLSTVEGMDSLKPNQKNNVILPLKEATVGEESYYADVLEDLNAGHTAPFVYSGWENAVVSIGTTMIDYICDKATLDDVIQSFDDSQRMITHNETKVYTTATEDLDISDCARLVGICFAQATGSDLALISEDTWNYNTEVDTMNREGVSGSIYQVSIRDEEIVAILPTGWVGDIQTVTLTGARIKELAAYGYDRNGDGNTYPYNLVTKDGFEIDDDTTYTVAICGATQEVQTEGNMQDSGVVGLDAAKEYLGQFETLSKKDLVWE